MVDFSGISKPVPVVMGSYVNAYNIVRELNRNLVPNITLLDDQKKFGRFSRLLKRTHSFDGSRESLLSAITDIRRRHDYLVFYPTSDEHLRQLFDIYDDIASFSYIPFEKASLNSLLNKENQYDICREIGVPCPSYDVIKSDKDLQKLSSMRFPLIVKPTCSGGSFRNGIYHSYDDVVKKSPFLSDLLARGVNLLVSEIIPGDGSNIHAYTACISKKGDIVNDWVGRKITQHPDDYGVFSSATASDVALVKEYGKRLVKHMGVYGIVEPEFKFDSRDNSYYLMEVNLRSMMWHRVGALSGVDLHYTQWQLAIGEPPTKNLQSFNHSQTLIYMKHEISNLLCRRGYFKTLKDSKPIYSGRFSFAVFNFEDPIPAIIDSLSLPFLVVGRWLKVFGNIFQGR